MQREVETADVERKNLDQKDERATKIERRARTDQQRRSRMSYLSLSSFDINGKPLEKLRFPTVKLPFTISDFNADAHNFVAQC